MCNHLKTKQNLSKKKKKTYRSLRPFWKENYAIALDSCYLFTEKMLEMELNMTLTMLMVCLHALDIPELYGRFDAYLAI